MSQLAASGHQVENTVRRGRSRFGVDGVAVGEEFCIEAQDYTRRTQKAISTIFSLW